MDNTFQSLQRKWGISFMGANPRLLAMDSTLAMDAEPSLVTVSNSGIPAFLSTYIDPKVIEICVAPNKATEIVGEETKKGDWTLETSMFPISESTGQVSSYGDFSATGFANSNVNWVQRQSYTYQIITQWGERALEMMGLGRIDWAQRQRVGAVTTLNKFQNKTYFFGVEGLANYGLMNDPTLLPSIAPLSVIGSSGDTLVTWEAKGNDSNGAVWVYNDIKAIYGQLVLQANGLVDLDMSSAMTLAMSPEAQVYLTLTNQYNVNVQDMLKKNFPKLRIETAPEYALPSGQLVQLFADELQGQRTATTAFTEKLRAHPVKIELSSFKQKMSQGSWGTIIYRPFLMSSMVGIL